MSNLTLKIDDKLLDQIKVYAAKNKTSLSSLIRDYFKILITNLDVKENINDNYSEFQILKDYSEGNITVFEAMKILKVGRFEIYPLLKKYELYVPEVSDLEAITSAENIAKVINSA